MRERDRAVNYLLLSGDRLHDQGRDDEAYSVLPAGAGDRQGQHARQGRSDSIETGKRHEAILAEANVLFDKGDLEAAQNKLQAILIENPQHAKALALHRQIEEKQAMNTQMLTPTLKSKFRQPVTLQFRDANLKMVFEALSRSSGINILLDRDMKNDLKTSIFVKDASVEDTLDLILMQNQLEKKVLNDSTVFIYPNTPAKIKEYQDMVIRTFQLTNADAKQMQTMIKTMLKTKDHLRQRKEQLAGDARHAGGGADGREADRHAGHQRARGDAGSGSAGSAAFEPDPAGHQVAQPARLVGECNAGDIHRDHHRRRRGGDNQHARSSADR